MVTTPECAGWESDMEELPDISPFVHSHSDQTPNGRQYNASDGLFSSRRVLCISEYMYS